MSVQDVYHYGTEHYDHHRRQLTRSVSTFLLIGAMKAGTTSLYRYLSNHPQVFMSSPKELDYFVTELNLDRGLDWYLSHFAEARNDQVAIGEASTSYTKHPMYPGVAERVAALLPDVKLVYVVREPIARMKSHYLHELSKGREKKPINEALLNDPRYITCSSYAMQLEQYLEHFDRARILVVTAEELGAQRDRTVGKVLEHLGVSTSWRDPVLDRSFNTTDRRRVIRPFEHRLRRVPGFKQAMRITPKALKHRVRRFTTRPIDDELQRAVIEDAHGRGGYTPHPLGV